MTIQDRAIAIGLTGPFGSGCSTAAEQLCSSKGCAHIRLSNVLRERWKEEHGDVATSRADLQELGNQLRESNGDPGYLAQQAIAAAEATGGEHSLIVFDGIRNPGEVETFKDRFGRRFYLVSIDCPASDRWERLRASQYEPFKRGIVDFNADDQRDRDQEYAYGQRVQICVDLADLHIRNPEGSTLAALRKKALSYIDVLTGDEPRYPEPHEILMNLAYSSSHGSKCLKRQVGAVIVAAGPLQDGPVVGIGFNENPIGTRPCVEEPRYEANSQQGLPGRCYRDIVRQEMFEQLAEAGARCPKCGEGLTGPISTVPPWRCSYASCRVDLEDYFWPERAMTLCTAVHAEVVALLAAGDKARNSTLYTSTFPCFECAEKIVHVGVRYVVYTEPYADVRAAQRLEIGGIKVARFEGVRSGRFDEIFARARPYVSEQLKILAARTST